MEKKPPSFEAGSKAEPVEGHAAYLRHRPESVAEAIGDVRNDMKKMVQIMESDPSRIKEMLANMKMIEPYLESLEKIAKNNEDHATFDTLTELPNLRSFNETLKNDVSHALRLEARGEPHHLHVLFIDVDHFKNINDTLGHDIGDLYLKTVATHMRHALRREDIVARKGGDEFVAILLDCDDNVAREVAEKLRVAVAEASIAAKHEFAMRNEAILPADEANVTASIGVASFLGKDDSVDSLVKRADRALYTAKGFGKNQVVVFSDILDTDGDGDGEDSLRA